MSESVMRLTATELKVVRVTCHECQVTTELAVSRLSKALGSHGECVHCGTDLLNIERFNPLTDLKQALERLEDAAARMQVEFVIPIK